MANLDFFNLRNFAERAVNMALDEYEYKGKTIREWADRIAKPKTNADRIRTMTDEELAQMFWEKASCELCKLKKQYCSDDCKGTWLEWLKEEANDGKS